MNSSQGSRGSQDRQSPAADRQQQQDSGSRDKSRSGIDSTPKRNGGQASQDDRTRTQRPDRDLDRDPLQSDDNDR